MIIVALDNAARLASSGSSTMTTGPDMSQEAEACSVTCRACGAAKPPAAYYPSSLKLGQRLCRVCSKARSAEWRLANPDKARSYGNAWYARNRRQAGASSKAWEQKNRAKRTERLRDLRATGWKVNYDLLTRYGITVNDYQRMLDRQSGKCACCGCAAAASARGGRLYVDHCHETGQVRGLLCHKCNSGIGLLGDSAPAMRRALGYLSPPDTAGVCAGVLF